MLNALCASGYPFVAFRHRKMWTIGSKGPTIMECPDQFCPVPAEPGKERFQIAVMTMDVVQVHDIRPDPFQFRNHLLGCLPGMKAIVTH